MPVALVPCFSHNSLSEVYRKPKAAGNLVENPSRLPRISEG